MDKRFLDKVVDQIVSETKIDYRGRGKIFIPFSFPFPSSLLVLFPFYSLLSSSNLRSNFFNHCRDVYGLNNEESKYVWEEYKRIIKDKIDSNG